MTLTSPATASSSFGPHSSEPPLKVLLITNPMARVLARHRGVRDVVARALGLSRDPVEAARQVVRRATAKPRPLPLGRVGDRYFVANCGVGLDAAIVRHVETHPRLKQAFGDLYFIWTGLRLFFLRG